MSGDLQLPPQNQGIPSIGPQPSGAPVSEIFKGEPEVTQEPKSEVDKALSTTPSTTVDVKGIIPKASEGSPKSVMKWVTSALKSACKLVKKSVVQMFKQKEKVGGLDEHLVTPQSDNVTEKDKHLTHITQVVNAPTEDTEEQVLLNKADPKSADGVLLEADFVGKDGKPIAKEVLERSSTVTKSIKNLQKTIQLLEEEYFKARDKEGYSSDKAMKINVQLEAAKQSLKNLQEYQKESGKDWITTNYHRNFIKSIDIKGKTQKEIDAEFRKRNKAQILTAPLNMRYHSLQMEAETKSGMIRTGALCDHRNEFMSLDDMVKFSQDSKAKEARIRELEAEKRKAEHPLQKAAIQYAIDDLDPRNIMDAIAERELILDQQALLIVSEHLKRHPEAINPGGTFNFAHVGFLNQNTSTIEKKTGWNHDELRQMQDMNTAFARLAGKKIVFDSKDGDAIDPSSGVIHMKRPEGITRDEITISEPIYINISVQGLTKNEGYQKELNGKNIAKLETLIKNKTSLTEAQRNESLALLEEVKKLLNEEGVSDYLVAEKFERALQIAKIPYSHGCFGAKDRTAYVSYRALFNDLCARITDPNQKKYIQNKYAGAAIDRKRPNSKAVTENTEKVHVLKVSSFNLPGITQDVKEVGKKVKGVWDRLSYYFIQGADITLAPLKKVKTTEVTDSAKHVETSAGSETKEV